MAILSNIKRSNSQPERILEAININNMWKISLILGCLFLGSACNNSNKKNIESTKDTTKSVQEVSTVEASKDTISKTWIDSFNAFRKALYTNDRATLKTYFSFPLSEEKASIWFACYISESDLNEKRKKDNSSEYSEEYFDKYYSCALNEKFLNVLMKVDAEDLYHNDQTENKEFQYAETPYILYVSHLMEVGELHFNMSFSNNDKDENGEPVSEGEHNVIYIFDVIGNTEISFKKVVVAG